MYAKKIFIAAVALFFAGAIQSGAAFSAPSDLVTKNPGESDAAFVARITKHDITTVYGGGPQLGNTSALIKGAQTLVAFTNVPDSDPSEPGVNAVDIDMNVFIRQSGLSYARIDSMQVCEVEGSSASMRSFFYTQLKNPSQTVVGVICGWDEGHRYAECQLNDEVRFFQVNDAVISRMGFNNGGMEGAARNLERREGSGIVGIKSGAYKRSESSSADYDNGAISAIPMDKFDKIFYKQSGGCTVSKFETVEDVKKLLRSSQ
jgi:hypothetical protein